MEARIQTRTLPAVGCAVLFGFFDLGSHARDELGLNQNDIGTQKEIGHDDHNGPHKDHLAWPQNAGQKQNREWQKNVKHPPTSKWLKNMSQPP
jgi:hypothetical protein